MQIIKFADNGKEFFFFSCSAVQTKGFKNLNLRTYWVIEHLVCYCQKRMHQFRFMHNLLNIKKIKNQLHIYFGINQDKVPEISCDYIFSASLHNLYWIQKINRTKKSLKNAVMSCKSKGIVTLVWSSKRKSSNPRQVLSPRGNSVQEKNGFLISKQI